MKTLIYLKSLCAILFLSTLCIISCQKENLPSSAPNENYKMEDHGDYKYHIFTIDNKNTIVKEVDGKYFYSECEILTNEQFNKLKRLSNPNLNTTERSTVTKNFTTLWTKGIVYYTVDNIATKSKKDSIQKAITDLQNKTKLVFIERTNEANYIRFKDGNSNSSPLGMIGGRQDLNLYNSHVGIIQHEIMHALGIHHEQCRPDRDSYVILHTENVEDGMLHNFNISNSFVGLRAFDTESIMLYGSFAFTSNNRPTLTLRDSVTTWVHNSHIPGRRLSKGDIEGINYLYQYTDMKAALRLSQNLTLVSAVNNSSAIYLNNGNTNTNTPITLWALNNNDNQTWKIVNSSVNGEYYIESLLNSNKVLGIQNDTLLKGQDIVIKDKISTNQTIRWKIYHSKENSGYVRISPAKNSNLAIAVNGSSTSNGTRIRLENYNSAFPNNQKFRLLYHE